MQSYYFFLVLISGALSVADARSQEPAPTPPIPQSLPTPLTPPTSIATQATPAPPVAGAPHVTERYVPHRVYDAKKKRFVDFETMTAALARADLVFLGEQHNDPGTHRLQLAVLEGLARRRTDPVVVALEMFERDVQPGLNAYLGGSLDEAAFLASARPWPNYTADYRPLVEFARSRSWPVVAGNVPRRLAQVVSRGGLGAVDSLPEADRALIADDLRCPRDDYWRRFRAVMGDLSGHGMQLTPEQANALVWRMYEAQCVKDETMGEAIAESVAAHRTLVVHANGAFHSDHRLGTAARARRRLPQARMMVVSFVPVSDLDAANGKANRRLGDWVVFTLRPPAAAPTP